MEWKSVKLPTGAKLFRVHAFTFVVGGATYQIEVDEYQDGNCTGHAERSTDKSSIVEPVSARSIKDCLEGLIGRIKSRHP